VVLPFWYWLTWVVPEKEPLNGSLKVDRMSIERMFAGSEFQVEGVDREKECWVYDRFDRSSVQNRRCRPVFEKTCATTRKKRKKSCFWIFEKKRKNVCSLRGHLITPVFF